MVIKLYEHTIKNEKGAEYDKQSAKEKKATEDAEKTYRKVCPMQDSSMGI